MGPRGPREAWASSLCPSDQTRTSGRGSLAHEPDVDDGDADDVDDMDLNGQLEDENATSTIDDRGCLLGPNPLRWSRCLDRTSLHRHRPRRRSRHWFLWTDEMDLRFDGPNMVAWMEIPWCGEQQLTWSDSQSDHRSPGSNDLFNRDVHVCLRSPEWPSAVRPVGPEVCIW